MNQEETFSLKHILFKTPVKDNICQVLNFFNKTQIIAFISEPI